MSVSAGRLQQQHLQSLHLLAAVATMSPATGSALVLLLLCNGAAGFVPSPCARLPGLTAADANQHQRMTLRAKARAPFMSTSTNGESALPIPSGFLAPANFSRALSQHRTVAALQTYAPSAFAMPPDSSILADDIFLAGDLGQILAKGKDAYVNAFTGLARMNGSPLLPLRAGDVAATFEPEADAVTVRWKVPVRGGGGGGGGGSLPTFDPVAMSPFARGFTLSGVSTYAFESDDAASRRRLASHRITDLRVDGRQLPSSFLGEVVTQRGGSMGGGGGMELLAALGSALATAPSSPSSPSSSSSSSSASSTSSTSSSSSSFSPAPVWPSAGAEPPAPGSGAWPAYEATHYLATSLVAQFRELLDASPPDASELSRRGYASEVTLRSEGGERLLQGTQQYAQLLSSIVGAHRALIASPLLKHSFAFRLSLDGASHVGPWVLIGGATPPTDLPPPPTASSPPSDDASAADSSAAGSPAPSPSPSSTPAAPPLLTVTWLYSLQAIATPGSPSRQVFSLGANSDFGLERSEAAAAAAAEAEAAVAATFAGDAGVSAARTSSSSSSSAAAAAAAAAASASASSLQRFVIRTHTLRGLTLNGRPALPAALLAQLERAEASSPELLQFFSSAFLTLSESLAGGLPAPARAAKASSSSSSSSELLMQRTTPLSPAYAMGFTALLRSLHQQLPTLLAEPPDLSIAANDVVLRGLLRERLAAGKPPLTAAFAAARRVYATLLSEGAISPSRGNQGGDGGGATATAEQQALQYQLVVTREGDVTVEWNLESNVGPSWNGGNGNSPFGGFGAPGQPPPPLRVGLPVRIRGQVRLRPDEATGAVKEVWIKALSINERPLLPKLLSQWVQQGSAGGASAAVGRDVRTMMAALLPWIQGG